MNLKHVIEMIKETEYGDAVAKMGTKGPEDIVWRLLHTRLKRFAADLSNYCHYEARGNTIEVFGVEMMSSMRDMGIVRSRDGYGFHYGNYFSF